MIELDIINFLKADAAVAAIVGGRVYAVNLPQAPSYPAIAVQQISHPRGHTIDGQPDFATPRFQLACFADTYKAAKLLARAVVSLMDGHIGPLGDEPIQATLVLDEHDAFEAVPRAWMLPVDIQVQYAISGVAGVSAANSFPRGRVAYTGAIDGNNTVFTLAVPVAPSQLQVVFNAAVQYTDAYQLSGTTVTLTFTPKIGDTLEFFNL